MSAFQGGRWISPSWQRCIGRSRSRTEGYSEEARAREATSASLSAVLRSSVRRSSIAAPPPSDCASHPLRRAGSYRPYSRLAGVAPRSAGAHHHLRVSPPSTVETGCARYCESRHEKRRRDRGKRLSGGGVGGARHGGVSPWRAADVQVFGRKPTVQLAESSTRPLPPHESESNHRTSALVPLLRDHALALQRVSSR